MGNRKRTALAAAVTTVFVSLGVLAAAPANAVAGGDRCPTPP